MQPAWQPWVVLPLRDSMTAAMVSPPTLLAHSLRPARKFLVGRPPASFKMLTRMLVPYLGRAWPVTGWVVRALVKRLEASLKASGLAMVTPGAPASSMTTALIFFAPMTAPRPPRPALRMLLWGSAKEMLAAVRRISPAGPMMATPTLGPYLAWSTLMAS